MTHDDNKSTGNFLTGLLFGAAAGAAGYFFMKTEEGKKAREKLSEEWEKAKEDMAKSGAIEDVTKSLPQTIQHTIQRIIEPKNMKVVDDAPSQEEKEAPAKKTVVKKTVKKEPVAEKKTKKNPSPKKFKGA